MKLPESLWSNSFEDEILKRRGFLEEKRKRNEPLLRDELRFEVTFVINSFRAYFCLFSLVIMLKYCALFRHKNALEDFLFNCGPLQAQKHKRQVPQEILNSILLDGAISQFLLSVSDCYPSTFSEFFIPLSLELHHIKMPNWRLCTKQMTTLASPLLTRPSFCMWSWCIIHSACTLLSLKLQCRLTIIWRRKLRDLFFCTTPTHLPPVYFTLVFHKSVYGEVEQ